MSNSFWQLNSNSGRESVRWDLSGERTSQNSKVLLCDVQLTGQYFGATLGGDDPKLRDYALVLRRLAIGVPELDRLSSFLRSWLHLPLADQANHPPAFDANVGGLFDQSLIMSLGKRDDTISAGKPVATFRYIAGRLRGELSFVTDQSCLRILSEGIDAVLESTAIGTSAS